MSFLYYLKILNNINKLPTWYGTDNYGYIPRDNQGFLEIYRDLVKHFSILRITKNNCEILKSHSKGYSLLLWDYNKINSGYRVTEWQRAYMSHSPHDWHYSEREGSYFYIAIVGRRYSITRVFILTSKHWNNSPYSLIHKLYSFIGGLWTFGWVISYIHEFNNLMQSYP